MNDNKLTNGIIEDSEAEQLRLRKDLADARRAKQSAEENSHKWVFIIFHMHHTRNTVMASYFKTILYYIHNH